MNKNEPGICRTCGRWWTYCPGHPVGRTGRATSVGIAVLLLLAFAAPASADYLPTRNDLAQALAIMPAIGEELTRGVAYQVGLPYRPGDLAYFGITREEVIIWGYEEWVRIEQPETTGEDAYMVIWWEFFRDGARRQANIYVGKQVINVSPMGAVPIVSPETIAKSERAWKILEKAGVTL